MSNCLSVNPSSLMSEYVLYHSFDCPSVCLSFFLPSSVCVSACLSVYLPVSLCIRLSVCLLALLLVCLPVFLFVCLTLGSPPVCLSVSQSTHLSACLPACPPACPPACMYACLPGCLPVCLSFHFPICLLLIKGLYRVLGKKTWSLFIRSRDNECSHKFCSC